jgi:hypothetical protein
MKFHGIVKVPIYSVTYNQSEPSARLWTYSPFIDFSSYRGADFSRLSLGNSVGGSLPSLPHDRLTLTTADESLYFSEPPSFSRAGRYSGECPVMALSLTNALYDALDGIHGDQPSRVSTFHAAARRTTSTAGRQDWSGHAAALLRDADCPRRFAMHLTRSILSIGNQPYPIWLPFDRIDRL